MLYIKILYYFFNFQEVVSPLYDYVNNVFFFPSTNVKIKKLKGWKWPHSENTTSEPLISEKRLSFK